MLVFAWHTDDTSASLCCSNAPLWIHICALMAINWENACRADPGTRTIHLTFEVQRLLAWVRTWCQHTGGKRRGGCSVDHSQCLFSGLTVRECWLSFLLSSVQQPPHKASIIWKYQQRLYSAISLWLYDLSASTPWCPLLPLDPSHGN